MNMDRGLVHKSSRLVGEIMGEGHGWWSVNNLRPPFEDQQQQQHNNPSLFLPTTTASSSSPLHSFSSLLLSNHYPLPGTNAAGAAPWQQHDSSSSGSSQGQLQEPWSHLFMYKNWEGPEQIPIRTGAEADAIGTSSSSSYMYSTAACHGRSSSAGDEIRSPWGGGAAGHHQNSALQQQASSPRSSCITSIGSNMLEFSNNNSSPRECISTACGAAFKKARTHEEPSPTNQSSVKVRKEKLGDRVTALHQLVSPFGKTDTASVLLEAIGYIRFLHSQIEVLTSPYQLGGNGNGNGSGGFSSSKQQQHEPTSVQQGERNIILPEDPGQDGSGGEEGKKDLRSRGLCLVPVSCTLDVGADVAGTADYWAAVPPFGMGFGR